MALRCVGVGAKKNQLCAVIAEHNRIAGELHIHHARKLDDVFTEHISLSLTGREKNLVVAGIERT